jgi:parallel beta-helix repeat protein
MNDGFNNQFLRGTERKGRKMRKNKKAVIILNLMVLFIAISSASAAVHLVPDDYPTIGAAVGASNDGDEVIVSDGIYTGDGNRDIDFLGKAITVRSENGHNNCIICCNGTEAEPHRGFYFHSGEDANSIIEGIYIAFGYAALGGGVCCEQSSPMVTNCIFYGNSAEAGGGISCDDSSSPKIVDCTFSYNTAYAGGGIYNRENSNPTVTNCTFNGNSTIVYQSWALGCGGGMCNVNSDPIVNNCTFIDNLAERDGGGICNYKNSHPKVSNCTFKRNVAENVGIGYGGGMMNRQGSKPEVTNCVFKNNRSSVYGGGMYNEESSNPTVTKCTFINNLSGRGGGMYNRKSSPMVNRCVFSSNAATDSRYVVWGRGGGMCNVDSSPRVKNCLFSNNSAEGMYPFLSATGGMDNDGGTPVITNCIFIGNSVADGVGGMNNHGGSSPSVTNCILWNNSPSQISGSSSLVSFSNVQGDWPGEGNINTNPLFVAAPTGDYHLLQPSPCINTGDPDFLVGPNETDLYGWPRVIGGRVDMGAYEFNHIPVADAGPDREVYAWIDGIAEVTLDGSGSYDEDGQTLTYLWSWTVDGNSFTATGADGIINMLDFAAFAQHWLQAESSFADIAPPSGDGVVDILDLLILTEAWLSTSASSNWNPQCDIAPASGPVLTIDLPVGEHIIELVVDDGLEDSQPDQTVITVIGPMESDLRIFPRTINRHSRLKLIMALVRLPQGVTKDQIDSDQPLLLYPGGIEASHQWVIGRGRRVKVFVLFGKAELMNAVPDNGRAVLNVVGRLKTGRYFYGADTVWIKGQR